MLDVSQLVRQTLMLINRTACLEIEFVGFSVLVFRPVNMIKSLLLQSDNLITIFDYNFFLFVLYFSIFKVIFFCAVKKFPAAN